MAEALPIQDQEQDQVGSSGGGGVGGGVVAASTDDPIESVVTCGVCLREFDIEYRRPLLLPLCGHTFCRTCIKGINCEREGVTCPSCRKQYKETEVDNFPINFNIQVLATSSKKQFSSISDCSEHNVRFAFWCRTCERAVCGECLFESHHRPQHDVCKIEEVVKEIKTRADTITRESGDAALEELGKSLHRVLKGISDLQEASHILQEVTRLGLRTKEAKTLPAITKAFEGARVVRERVSDLKIGNTDQCDDDTNTHTLIGCHRVKERPVVVALSDNGGLAQVKIEEKGIHIYSLQPSSTAYSVALKMSVLLGCVKKERPDVFLDLKAGDRYLGRVYINLWGKMRRAQQFMSLCLGVYGPTYKDTKFDGVSGLGEPGEYVRGGDYSGMNGMGGTALIDNLEWGGEWSRRMQAGQVCGVGGEDERKFGSLFAICLKDNPNGTFRAPFGMVSSGLEVIEVACRHKPFSVVRISECGVLLRL